MRTSPVLVAVGALALPLLVTAAAPAAPPRQSAAAARQSAAAAHVTVANMAFSPSRVAIAVGETVTWTFEDLTSHTATSDNGFFNTGAASGGASRSVRFRSSGTYPYHCTFHPMMVGRVSVPVSVSGSKADGWRLRWLAGENPKNRSYDVQVRRKGTTTWKYLRRGTTAATARYSPSSGIWQVRARTHKGAVRSGWSPVAALS